MTVFSLYRYLLILFVTNNKHPFDHNNDIHDYNNADPHLPTIQLTKYGKSPYITGIRVFNHLPQIIKTLAQNPNKFKTS
jgi:hypothetical protein